MREYFVSCGFQLPEPRTIEAESPEEALKTYLRLLGKIRMECRSYSSTDDELTIEIPVRVSNVL